MPNTPGKGTVLQLAIGTTFTTIARGVTITPFEATNTPIDTTILTSTAKLFEETGVPDYGTLQLTGNLDYSDTTHQHLANQFSAGNSSNSWRINFSDTGTAIATFLGPVVAFAIGEANVDNVIQFTAGIKISGGVTLTT